jgi:WD40 repeat protein
VKFFALAVALAACVRPTFLPPPGVEIATLSPTGSTAAAAVLLPDGHRQIRLWNQTIDVPTIAFEVPHQKPVTALAFSLDGKLIASASAGMLAVQRTANGEIVRTIEGTPGGEGSIALAPDGAFVVSAWKGGARAFPLPEGEGTRIEHPGAQLVAAAGGIVATAGPRVVGARTFAFPSGIESGRYGIGGARCLALSSDGRFLAAGKKNGDVVLWDLRGRPPVAYAGAQLGGEVDLVDFLPGAHLVAASRPAHGEAGYVQLVKLDKGTDELATRIEAKSLWAVGWNLKGLALLGERCDDEGCRLGIFKP